jgi:hypothetical protein
MDKWHEEVTAEGLVGKGNLRLLIATNMSFMEPLNGKT